MRVLAIEHHRALLELMRSHLKKRGIALDGAASLTEGLALAPDGGHEVMLLGLPLPDGDVSSDGAGVLARVLRVNGTTRIIVLSERDDVAARVEMLDAGADDYLVKPFDLDELAARIRAVARRGQPRPAERLGFADVEFDRRSGVAVIAGRAVSLRPREAVLFESLLRRPGETVDRDVLHANLYSMGEEIGSNSLDVHIHHLRRRLAAAGARLAIATVRGHGYALREMHR